jgi:serine/threonine protein kinase
MQFQFNADFPDRFYINHGGDSMAAAHLDAKDPYHFPPVQPSSCARITTRVYNPITQTITTVHNVLVKLVSDTQSNRRRSSQQSSRRLSAQDFNANANPFAMSDDDSNLADIDALNSSSSDFSSDHEMEQGSSLPEELEDASEDAYHPNNTAYWIQNTIREAIYGRVFKAVVLRKIPPRLRHQIVVVPQPAAVSNVEWEMTSYACAIKEMSWQHIRRERDRLAEDPVKEVCAMQFFKEWYGSHIRRTTTTTMSVVEPMPVASSAFNPINESFQQMTDTNVMVPLDLLSDERHLYSIMPYCNGGELFELLNVNDRFSEAEARYWMKQVLNGIECLQHAGICHRDMSLENLLVHESGVLIIDMGMCLRVPFHLGEAHPHNAQKLPPAEVPMEPSVRSLRRFMMRAQGTCGKWHYMSPEIHSNSTPFDGYAVDMWAAGVILFLMLTGFPPWDRPSPSDERFKYMSAGYLVQMLTEWEIGLSPDAMDLLQRMLFLDPKDRLSLDQVRAHPWMVNGPCQPPAPYQGTVNATDF